MAAAAEFPTLDEKAAAMPFWPEPGSEPGEDRTRTG